MYSFLPLLLFAVVAAADARVYKCAGDKGGVTYQDTACAPGRELGNPEADPATQSATPLTTPTDKSAPASASDSTRLRTGTVTVPGGSPAERKFLQAGMSEAEVLQRVGRPDVESNGRAKEGRRWTYLPTDGDPGVLTTLTFGGGKVTHIERKVMH
jgi:hypothetical protein